MPNSAELNPNRSSTDNHHGFGLFLLQNGLPIRQNSFAVDFPTLRNSGPGPRSYDDVLGLEFSGLTFIVGNSYGILGGDFSFPHVDIDLVLSHQVSNTLNGPLGYLAAALYGFGKIQLKVLERKSEFLTAFAQNMSDLSIPE